MIRDRFDTLYFIAVLNTLTTPELRVRFARFLIQTILAEPLGFGPAVQARWVRLLSVFAEPDTELFGEAFRLGLPETTRSIKVAVLISGQIRQGFGDVITTLQHSLPNTVSADLILSTWAKTGRSKRAEEGEQKIRAEDEIAALGLTEAFAKIDIEDEDGLEFSNNQEKQHYKLWRTFEQAEALGDYDLYLRMRPDLLLETSLAPEMFSRALRARQGDQLIWGPAPLCARTDLHEPYIYVSDNFALAQPAAYRRFANTWNNLERVKDMFGMNAPRD